MLKNRTFDDPEARDREARVQLMQSSMRRFNVNRKKHLIMMDNWGYGLIFGMIAFVIMVAVTAWVFSGG